MPNDKNNERPVEQPIVFTKEKLLTFKRFADRRDLLCALLDEDETYTIKQVEKMITDFMRGRA